MIKNRKGDGVGMPVLLLGVVAVIALVLVIIFVWGFYTGKAIPFAQYLPSFSSNKDKVEGIEILKYTIYDDSISYYDGTSWIKIDENHEVELGDKVVFYDDIYRAFHDFYYLPKPPRKSEEVVLIGQLKDRSPAIIRNMVDVKTGEDQGIPLGSVLVLFGTNINQRMIYELILTFDDEIMERSYDSDYLADPIGTFRKKEASAVTGDYLLIKERAVEWRNGPLKKAGPLEIYYTANGKNLEKTREFVKVCVTMNGADLIVDLSKPEGACGEN